MIRFQGNAVRIFVGSSVLIDVVVLELDIP
jgi:hypothetical protein